MPLFPPPLVPETEPLGEDGAAEESVADAAGDAASGMVTASGDGTATVDGVMGTGISCTVSTRFATSSAFSGSGKRLSALPHTDKNVYVNRKIHFYLVMSVLTMVFFFIILDMLRRGVFKPDS